MHTTQHLSHIHTSLLAKKQSIFFFKSKYLTRTAREVHPKKKKHSERVRKKEIPVGSGVDGRPVNGERRGATGQALGFQICDFSFSFSFSFLRVRSVLDFKYNAAWRERERERDGFCECGVKVRGRRLERSIWEGFFPFVYFFFLIVSFYL